MGQGPQSIGGRPGDPSRAPGLDCCNVQQTGADRSPGRLNTKGWPVAGVGAPVGPRAFGFSTVRCGGHSVRSACTLLALRSLAHASCEATSARAYVGGPASRDRQHKSPPAAFTFAACTSPPKIYWPPHKFARIPVHYSSEGSGIFSSNQIPARSKDPPPSRILARNKHPAKVIFASYKQPPNPVFIS